MAKTPATVKAQAAAMLGRGEDQQDVAAKVGTNPRTLRRWLAEDSEFASRVQAHRDLILTEQVTAAGTLEQALLATRKDGTPDWPTRVAASRALLATPRKAEQTQADQVAEALIHRDRLRR